MSTHFMGADGFRWPLNFKGGGSDGTKPCPSAKWIRIARVLVMMVFLLFILIML